MALPNLPQLQIADVLSTIGMTISVKGKASGATEKVINWCHDISALGGSPETLDATPLASLVQMNKSGIQAQDSLTVTYYYNDEDYKTLEDLKNAAGTTIKITMNNGTVFSNTGTVTANFVSDIGVNAMADAQATIDLDGAWTRTPANG